MSAVPERTLNWLYSVLTSEYRNVNRTYNDVATTLSHYRSLKARTEVYTFEDGSSALLLLLSGTLPVSYRGSTYRFPIEIWLPHAYPHQSPMLYVRPEPGMVLLPGNHVSSEGRIYHRYLTQWAEYWDRSFLLNFLDILRGIFAKEAPVAQRGSMGAQQREHQRLQSDPPPPAVPPPPEEWRRAQRLPLSGSDGHFHQDGAPPIPPKGAQGSQPGNSSYTPSQGRSSSGPPLPPLPPEALQGTQQAQPQRYENGVPAASLQPQPAYRQGSIGGDPRLMPPHMREHMSAQRGNSYVQQDASPVSPLTPPHAQEQYDPAYHQRPVATGGHTPYGTIPALPQGLQFQAKQQQFQQPRNFQPLGHPQQWQHPMGQATWPSSAPKSKAPAVDLLTSPLDVTLPSQGPNPQAGVVAPPIPPNPEKDALLSTLADSFHTQITSNLHSNAAAAQSLQAQSVALNAALQRLQSEISHLAHLDAAIDTNTRILHETMREADRVMEDAKHRQRPAVDDVLVAPTVVAGQLYREAAEVEGLGEVRGVLGRGLDSGVIGAGEFVKILRGTAREEFLKKALVKKISRGLGLEELGRG